MSENILISALLFYARYWFVSIPLSFLVFFVVILMFAFLKNRGKIACLYYETDKSCRMTYKKLEPAGTVTIDEKKFTLMRSRPTMYLKRLRFFPMYVLKYDMTEPINIVKTAEEQTKGMDKDERILPATLNEFMNMTTLKSLLSIKGEERKGLVMFIFVGFVIGFLLSVVLIMMDIIKLKGGV